MGLDVTRMDRNPFYSLKPDRDFKLERHLPESRTVAEHAGTDDRSRNCPSRSYLARAQLKRNVPHGCTGALQGRCRSSNHVVHWLSQMGQNPRAGSHTGTMLSPATTLADTAKRSLLRVRLQSLRTDQLINQSRKATSKWLIQRRRYRESRKTCLEFYQRECLLGKRK